MEPKNNNLANLIKTAPIPQIIQSAEVGERFKNLYRQIHGMNTAQAEAFYTAETFHFLKLVHENKKIAACTKMSLYGIFMDVAVNRLSFDPSMKHLYVVPYNVNVGTKKEPRWEARAALQISGPGELLLRQLQGQVKYADNPITVYEGDEFKFGTRDNKTIIEHMACFPRKSDQIIACYIKITRYDDSIDYKVFAMEDILQLRKFSKDPDSLSWTSGIAGMVQTKTIKHAFKNYPKLRVGDFSRFETEVIEQPEQLEQPFIDYGISVGTEDIPHEVLPPATPANVQTNHDDDQGFEITPKTTPVPEGITLTPNVDEEF